MRGQRLEAREPRRGNEQTTEIGLKATEDKRQRHAVLRQRENRAREGEKESVYSERLEGFKQTHAILYMLC